MAKRRRKQGQAWWQRRRALRRLALLAVAALVAGLAVWLVVSSGGGGGKTNQYLREPAPAFSLPTVAGQQVSLADHLGQHPLLLYFNEGMG